MKPLKLGECLDTPVEDIRYVFEFFSENLDNSKSIFRVLSE